MRSMLLLALSFTSLLSVAPVAAGGSSCDADINHDGAVNTLDLGIMLSSWTLPPATVCSGAACQSDLDGNNVVNTLDLGILLSAFGTICNLATETELAGNSLTTYPFFEYVTAFNRGAPVQVALDPTRFPQIVGHTVSIYIVADKSAAQWAANPALVDLTPGGAMTVAFAAGTIQANTFTVDTGTLSAVAGLGIGVPYDVVVDMNQNGVLDSADFIDGFSGAGGMYVVHDLTLPGPFPVSEIDYQVTGVTPGFPSENTFFPTIIGSLGQLPLVVVSHGNGHFYQWYDHIGLHLASYGYIVMSHMNNTVPGVASAATTTLEHTNAIIAQQATIAGGVLNGHIDASRIVWIGHSRGGEGVAIAYDRVFDGAFTPVGWNLNSIKLISSMAPVSYLGPVSSDPHGVNYHVWVGSADSDVTSCPIDDSRQSFELHDRATDFRQSISIYGAGHSDFHNGGGFSFATGPCLIGQTTTHTIMRGYLLPLVEHYVEGNVPARDFLWRQWERFRPIGAPSAPSNPCIVVNFMYRDGSSAGNFKIDDYQSQFSPAVSSSGGAVSSNVTNLLEARLDDANTDLTWTPTDPMNGMTFASATDTSRGAGFDWDAPRFMEFAVPAGAQDLTGRTYLSFRACQGTRHPFTIAALEDLTFNVTLRDAAGHASTINLGAYGGGIEEPYQRTDCGTGVGWANEFETIRIRLTDFLNNGSGVDLASIVAVRLDFGVPGTSAVGRIGLDEIELTSD